MKHFKEAKSLGDILVVSITPDKFVNKGPSRPAFTTPLSLEFLAEIELIDFVVNQWPSAEELLKMFKPNVYYKGPDYKDHLNDLTEKIDDEALAIELVVGKIVYTDDITFSSSNLLNKFGNLFSKQQEFLIQNIVKKYTFDQINTTLEDIKKLKVLIVVEAIIDGVGDKTLSVEENSKISGKYIDIKNAEIGITSKDLPEVNLSNVKIKDTRRSFAVFQKKEEYGVSEAKILDLGFNIPKSDDAVDYFIKKNDLIKINSSK